VSVEAVGVPESFELAVDLVRPGGHIANVGVHGRAATLHLERLWIRDVTVTTGLVDTYSTPQLLKLVASGRLDPTLFATHRFPLGETMAAYDVFADAAGTGALKVVLEGAQQTSGTLASVGAEVHAGSA
jgi:alcohol dehydrogenase